MKTDKLTIKNNDYVVGGEEQLPHNGLAFCNDDLEEVGRFVFSKDKLEFTGNPSESAKVFIKWAKYYWNGIIQDTHENLPPKNKKEKVPQVE